MSFIVKAFFPLLTMLMILYFVYYLPVERPGIRMCVVLAVLITNTIYYVQLLSRLTGQEELTIATAFFSIYGLALLSAILSFFMYVLHKRQSKKILWLLRRSIEILYPAIVVIIGLLLMGQYPIIF